jgi:hypothetical protein
MPMLKELKPKIEKLILEYIDGSRIIFIGLYIQQ